MNGGTPAIENKDSVKKKRYGESKLKLEKEQRDLEELIIFEDIIQKTTINVKLYINVYENKSILLVQKVLVNNNYIINYRVTPNQF